jgi:hypothetical protein
MRRRDFLAMGVAMAIAARTGIGRGAPSKASAAVVIGVDKPGNLPALRGAGAGARSVAEWLGGEGFEIRAFVDDAAPVTTNAIYTAITDIVNRGTLNQILIYFPYNGYILKYAQIWMLRELENPNEAISLRGVDLPAIRRFRMSSSYRCAAQGRTVFRPSMCGA